MRELAASVKEQGVLQPILVRPATDSPDKYEIVAGERRWRAAQLAGLAQIPAIVKPLEDDVTLEVALIENIQRQDLNPLEEAASYVGFWMSTVTRRLHWRRGLENRAFMWPTPCVCWLCRVLFGIC